jgi:hypothetical protein
MHLLIQSNDDYIPQQIERFKEEDSGFSKQILRQDTIYSQLLYSIPVKASP